MLYHYGMDYKVHKINEVFGGEAYLIISGDDAVLVDSGYAVGVEDTIKNIEEHLDGRALNHIFLSHSHYDHVMGSPAISLHFHDAKIYAHPEVRKIFGKSGARKVMEDMNEAAASDRGVPSVRGWSDKLHVDIDVHDGDEISAGNMKIRIIGTPGHTRCSVSLYFENEDLLFAAETLGLPLNFPDMIPGFVSSYYDAIKSIKRIMGLSPDNILLPHSHVASGEDAKIYLAHSLEETERTYEIITESNKKGCSVSEIVEQLKSKYYCGRFKEYQPDDAFYANFIPLVRNILAN